MGNESKILNWIKENYGDVNIPPALMHQLLATEQMYQSMGIIDVAPNNFIDIDNFPPYPLPDPEPEKETIDLFKLEADHKKIREDFSNNPTQENLSKLHEIEFFIFLFQDEITNIIVDEVDKTNKIDKKPKKPSKNNNSISAFYSHVTIDPFNIVFGVDV